MPFEAHVLKVLIASPGDTTDERNAVERALHGWNAARAEREGVILLPRRYESDTVPLLGKSGQGVVNDQLVDNADIVVALFDSRLGKATQDAVSGTAEEIERANAAGVPVHVYFSDEPLPRDVDEKQLAALRKFKARLEPQGFIGSYADPEDLGFQVRNAIEHDLTLLALGAIAPRRPTEEHADLRAEYMSDREPHVDNKGRMKYRTRNERLVITNHGTVRAERVRVEVTAPGEAQPPILHNPENTTPDILPNGGYYSFPFWASMGTSLTYTVHMTWHEGEAERTVSQDLSG